MNARQLAALAVLFAAACSSTPAPQPEPVVTAEPVMTAAPTAEPTAEPTATVDVPPASTLPPPSGRAPMVESKPETIFGSFGATPAAKLELTKEGAVMRIPEYALGEGVMITFTLDKKGKKAKGGAGSVYRVMGQQPPSEDAKTVTSRGPAFTFMFPNAKVATPNLAIGEPKKDDKGKETIEWRIVAPTKTEGDKVTFELTTFTNTYLQITSEAPSAPAAAPAP